MRVCVVDGVYPAAQFLLNVKTLGAPYPSSLTDEDKEKITKALAIPMSGLVNIQFVGRRVIITNTIPEDQHEYWKQRFTEAITNALK